MSRWITFVRVHCTFVILNVVYVELLVDRTVPQILDKTFLKIAQYIM